MGLFGPGRAEKWQAFSAEIGAKYTRGNLLKVDRVDAHIENWTVTLDTLDANEVIYTRLRAPYRNPSGMRFSISRTGAFAGIKKAMGFQDIEIGDPIFDKAFVVTGNNEPLIIKLLQDPKVQTLLNRQPDVSLDVLDNDGLFGAKFPNDCDELRFLAEGVITEIDQLKALFNLFATVLHQLTVIGAAQDGSPGVTL